MVKKVVVLGILCDGNFFLSFPLDTRCKCFHVHFYNKNYQQKITINHKKEIKTVQQNSIYKVMSKTV